MPILPRHAAIQQRQLHILQRTRPRQQVEPLKNEPQRIPPQQRPLVRIQRLHRDAFIQVMPAGRCIQTPQHIHQRRFPRPTRPHDHHKLPLPNRQINPLQRLKRRIAKAIGFRQPLQFDERCFTRTSGELFRFEFSLNGSKLRDGFSASLCHCCSRLNGVNTCF